MVLAAQTLLCAKSVIYTKPKCLMPFFYIRGDSVYLYTLYACSICSKEELD